MDIRDLLRNLEPKDAKPKFPQAKKKDIKLTSASWQNKQKKVSRQVTHNLKKRSGI